MHRLWMMPCLGLLLLTVGGPNLAEPPGTTAPEPVGVVVEQVKASFAAHQAGLQPGDVLLRWRRAASPPANPEIAAGVLSSPFEIDEVELEQAPRGVLVVSGIRGDEPFEVRLPPGKWHLQTRPRLTAPELEAYEHATRLIDTEEIDHGLALWLEMASAFGEDGDEVGASWLFLRVASIAERIGQRETAERVFKHALRHAETSDNAWLLPQVYESLARLFQDRKDLARAAETYHRALVIRQASSSSSLRLATTLNNLGILALDRSDLETAEDFFRRSLVIRQRLAPQSTAVASGLNNVGIVAWKSGDLAAAEDFYRRSLAITEKLTPESIDVAAGLQNSGGVAWTRGDLATAEKLYRRSLAITEKLAPQSIGAAGSLNNLGLVAWKRGDLASAENFFRRSLSLQERHAPQSIDTANSLNNLGLVAWTRGDLATAEDFYLRSLAIKEKLAPQSIDIAASLTNLGILGIKRDDLTTAEDFLRRSLAIQERLAPQSIDVATTLTHLGDVAFNRKDYVTAEDYLRRALAIHEQLAARSLDTAEPLRRLGDIALARSELVFAEALHERALAVRRQRAPGSVLEAESCQRLATLHRRRNQIAQAFSFYDCAVAALEAQRGKLGGSDEVRSGFGAKYASTYREAVDFLVEIGRAQEAFHLLERYRARELLTLLAERDLVFSSDIPEMIQKRRAIADKSYDRALRQWMQLSDRSGAEEYRMARQQLETVRRRQDEIRAEIRAASPRLASLQDPQILDLDQTHGALDPGTLLLSFSIGKDQSHLFAVGPGKGDFRSILLADGEESLRNEVESFREALRHGRFDRRPEKALLYARRLGRLLLGPVSAQINQAERLLILADGPLHSLPFAALAAPAPDAGTRFLVEAKPVHLAASATVFARLKQERRERRPIRITAFGDPKYTAVVARNQDVAPQLLAVQRSGLDLAPLPATRAEVESLKQLHPRNAQVFLGAQATEGRAKAVGQETTHLHIASHGLLDDRFPLDSALVFSLPERWQEGEDNGLLQAWEIFEQVRIDADLVTLSACDTGLGKVLGGEGLQGLTRAFQYAGARSVLASLWSVSDTSTGELMKRFYGYLKQGQSKAEALRSAQLDLLGDPELSHPFHWAGFELFGDWR